MKIAFTLVVLQFIACSAMASQALKVEYRLESVSGGVEFKWSAKNLKGKPRTVRLENEAFLTNGDIEALTLKPLKSPPSAPNTFGVELIHTKDGVKKFDAVANRDRDRSYCVVIGGEVYQCLGFTPAVKGLWDKSTTIHGPFTKSEAKDLVTAVEGKPLE